MFVDYWQTAQGTCLIYLFIFYSGGDVSGEKMTDFLQFVSEVLAVQGL